MQDPLLKDSLEALINDARNNGIVCMVCNGTSTADWNEVIELSQKHKEIIPSIGLHPWSIKESDDNWYNYFKQTVDKNRCLVGEIGLDSKIETDFEQQKEVFLKQLRVAIQYDLPVSLHCRKAFSPLIDLIKSVGFPITVTLYVLIRLEKSNV